jgi:hypothetical protein
MLPFVVKNVELSVLANCIPLINESLNSNLPPSPTKNEYEDPLSVLFGIISTSIIVKEPFSPILIYSLLVLLSFNVRFESFSVVVTLNRMFSPLGDNELFPLEILSLAVFTSIIFAVFKFINALPKLESMIETAPYVSITPMADEIVLQGEEEDDPQFGPSVPVESETYLGGNTHGSKRLE